MEPSRGEPLPLQPGSHVCGPTLFAITLAKPTNFQAYDQHLGPTSPSAGILYEEPATLGLACARPACASAAPSPKGLWQTYGCGRTVSSEGRRHPAFAPSSRG